MDTALRKLTSFIYEIVSTGNLNIVITLIPVYLR